MIKRILVFLLFIAALLSACRESPQTMRDKQLDLAQKELEARNYEEALFYFQMVHDLDPKVLEAYEGIAEIYTARGKDQAAEHVLEQGIEVVGRENITEEHFVIILNLYRCMAEEAEAGRNRERAIELYGKMLELRNDPEITARLESLKEEERKTAELANRKEDLEDMARAIMMAAAGGADYDFHNDRILSEEFRDLADSLTEPYVFLTKSGNYICVYPGGYIYCGTMSDELRQGRGLWFYGDMKAITVADAWWDKDRPNGKATITRTINRAEPVEEPGNTYAIKTVETVSLADGIYEGEGNIQWFVDAGGCDHDWDVIYSEGVLQTAGEDFAALCKKCGEVLFADESVHKLEGL